VEGTFVGALELLEFGQSFTCLPHEVVFSWYKLVVLDGGTKGGFTFTSGYDWVFVYCIVGDTFCVDQVDVFVRGSYRLGVGINKKIVLVQLKPDNRRPVDLKAPIFPHGALWGPVRLYELWYHWYHYWGQKPVYQTQFF
jgi:hypothetical protein